MTEPINDIHPGDDENISDLLNKFSELITETVNHGTHILKWEVGKPGGDENIPIAMMLRHVLEMTDAISILVKKSSIDPCKPLLRGILEVFFALDFILRQDTKERALAFLVWHYHKDLTLLKNVSSDNSSSQFSKKMESDQLSSGILSDLSSKIDINEHIANIEKLLSLPLYQSAETEYQRIITSRKKVRQWFQLFSNIQTIEQLAIHLNHQALYEIMYRSWSGPIHGIDILHGKLSSSSEGIPQIVQIRYVKDAQMVTHFAVTLSLMVYNLMIDKRLVDYKNQHKEWYPIIKDRYQQLSGPELIKIT